MPDEAQPLAPSAERLGRTASTQPEPASGAAEKPADNGASGPVEHAQAAPDAAAAEEARPKPASPERPANTPAVRPSAAQPTRSGGSSNRVRARLARLGVQRSNPYNPVLEPLLRLDRLAHLRGHHPADVLEVLVQEIGRAVHEPR
ncbi:hypothetical protein AB0944_23020, partial [Streptomyces sp. NPDC048399]